MFVLTMIPLSTPVVLQWTKAASPIASRCAKREFSTEYVLRIESDKYKVTLYNIMVCSSEIQ